MNKVIETTLELAIFKERAICLLLAIVTIALGLASRAKGIPLPEFIASYAGDTLWALLVYWLVRALAPQAKVLYSASIAIAFAFFIEFSQFYQAPWINDIRATTLGALVLGFGFKFSDLLCYTVGVATGMGLNYWWQLNSKHEAYP